MQLEAAHFQHIPRPTTTIRIYRVYGHDRTLPEASSVRQHWSLNLKHTAHRRLIISRHLFLYQT